MSTLTSMLKRIVLSTLLSLALLTACAPEGALDDSPPEADGIGTSPSEPDKAPRDLPYPCGIWVSPTPELADARSLACAPADVVVYVNGWTTCSDAVGIAEYYPAWHGRSFVRRVTPQLRAVEAHCP